MASALPSNPSLDRLKTDARELQRAVTSGDTDARERVRSSHPRPDIALANAPTAFALHDAQLTVARQYGFSGWHALVHYLELAADLSRDPGAVTDADLSPSDAFCSLASLRYDRNDAPPRWQAAAELLAATPELVDQHVWAAAAAIDVDALGRALARDPQLARRSGGPFGWTPLLYLAYSRVPLGRSEADVLNAATLLLDAGADPNDGFLWCGMASPFTVLTGVFGEGEGGHGRQPRHQYAQALATLLLERGAHPRDHQTLYNRMFRPDNSHLELLFAYGLANAELSPWEQRFGEAMETSDQVWARQLSWAGDHGFTERLELLSRNGIDVSGVTVTLRASTIDPQAIDADGQTALHHAAWAGDLDLIRAAFEAGVDPSITDSRFNATALGYAEHAYQTEAAALIRDLTAQQHES